MHDLTPSNLSRPVTSMQPAPHGVGGWLLVLCMMLTLVGPAISVWLMTHDYAANAPSFAASPSLQLVTLASLALTACSVVFGAYAGIRLWRVRPGAVTTAKNALLVGLAVELATSLASVTMGTSAAADGGLIRSVVLDSVPSLVFFTLCFAYLNKSSRVDATYPSQAAGATTTR